MTVRDVIIVGAGPAGVCAAVQAKRLGLEVYLIDRQGVAGGLIANAFSIENYPGLPQPIEGVTFQGHLNAILTRFSIPVHLETAQQISRLDDNSWQVETQTQQLQARAVVVATGTVPKMLSFLGRDNVESSGRLFYEVVPLLQQLPNSKAVIIIGGGEASLDYGLSLGQRGCRVTILCRRAKPLVTGRLLQLVNTATNVEILTHTELVSASVDQETVGIDLFHDISCGRYGKKQCDALLVAIGRVPHVQSLLPESFSPLNSLTPTEGLFICGDARLGSLGQVGIAVGDGLEAAMKLNEYIGSLR